MATNPSSQSGGSNFANFIGQGIEVLQDYVAYGFDTLEAFASSRLGQMIIGNYMANSGVTDPQVSPMGYQGTVPYYTAVREAVPFTADPNRRAGSGGRRYFTDTQFLERPDADSGIAGGFAKYGYQEIDADGNPSPGSGVFGAVQTTPDRNLTNLEAARRDATQQGLGLAAMNIANPYGGKGTSPTPYPVGTDPYSMADTRAGSGQVTGGIGGQSSAGGYAGREQAMAAGGLLTPYSKDPKENSEVEKMATGRYLRGSTDGMADKIPSSIEGTQPAALSDGEFVIPADVVSHLGNGNSEAGANVLDTMMTKVRTERTGNPKQGKEINPQSVMQSAGIAGFANGGLSSLVNSKGPVRNFDGTDGNPTDDSGDEPDPTSTIGPESGYESSLANYAGQYVTDMLGKGRGLAELPYQAYGGPLTAGESDLQQQAFSGIGALDTPTGMGTGYDAPTFTAQDAQAGMSPFLQASLDPQIREARRQADISRVQNAARMAQAGSFGGSRQAILEAENLRNLGQQVGDITATGYQTAFEQSRDQFNKDQDRLQQGRQLRDRFGLDVLQAQRDAGGIQRDIESEGVAADKAQFEEERAFPYKNVQYMQSLLQALPLTAVNRQYTEPSEMFKFLDAQGLLETDEAKQNFAAILGGLGGLGSGATDFITALGGGATGILDYLGLGSGSGSGSSQPPT